MPIEFEKYEIDVQSLMRGLVHELRNPLSAILTASTLLPELEGADEESAMLLEVVRKESRRMNRILTEFSTFVKPPKPHLEVVDLAQIARGAMTRERNEFAHLPLSFRDEMPLHIDVMADPNLTEQALSHILNNAVEAIPQGGEIVLRSEPVGRHICLQVCDSGVGLSALALEKAFQPFFSQKPAATGLGLSIARMALRAEGGDCRIENGAVGACVTLELPLATSHSVA